MHSHHAVVDLPTVSVPLPTGTHSLIATLGRAGLVHAADGLNVSMLFRDELLASVSELLFIPLDRFKKALQRPRRGLELQSDGLGRLPMQIR